MPSIVKRQNLPDIPTGIPQGLYDFLEAIKANYDSGNIIVGRGEAGRDYSLEFDGHANQGLLTYMEDEDRLDFSMPIKVPSAERHIAIYIGATKKGSTPPTESTIGTVIVDVFNRNVEESFIAVEVPSDWDGVTDIKLEVHWLPVTAMADTETVIWEISYRVKTTNEAVDGGSVTSASTTYTQSGAGTAKERIDTTITIPYGDTDNPIVAGDIILIKFIRDFTNDTFAGDAGVIMWGIELNSNTIPKG